MCTGVYNTNPILRKARAQKQLAKFKMAKIFCALELPRLRQRIAQNGGLNLARGREVAIWLVEISPSAILRSCLIRLACFAPLREAFPRRATRSRRRSTAPCREEDLTQRRGGAKGKNDLAPGTRHAVFTRNRVPASPPSQPSPQHDFATACGPGGAKACSQPGARAPGNGRSLTTLAQ
jgi:hypothetical protein